ncbi:hypothetical protein JW935_03065 [candidate division KSB1 bacterium]|nr:hypothetical protein [candidate division KSB1 bacterium]
MIRKRLLVVFTITIALSTALWSQYVTQPVGDAGTVDWSNQMIRATGIGAPNPNMPETAQRAGAIEAAKRVALRNLLETVLGMNIDSETTVRNYVVENDVINTRVRGAVRNFTVIDTRYMSSGDIEVTVEMPITGVISDALLPQVMGGAPIAAGGVALCPVCGQPWPHGKPVPAGVTLAGASGAGGAQPAAGGAFTGLVVNAKGLGIRPAMAPKIVDENDQEVYGSKYVSREWAVQIGMVGYDKDVSKARANDRVTNNPLVVNGLRASGPNKADIVVSNADAANIRNAAATQNFLDKCKVMFIVD